MQPESAGDLATLHWEYVEKTLKKHGVPDHDITIAKFHYKSAFVHGFKHGYEMEKEEEEKEPCVGFEHTPDKEEEETEEE